MGAWYGLWHGGNGYSQPEPSDLEEFSSLADAHLKLVERHRHGHWRRSRFAFVNREPRDVLTPAVADDCEITLYCAPDALDFPARRVFIGPRGGACVELC